MSDLREAAQQALEALKGYRREMACGQPCDAERVLEATLAQQEQPDTDCHAQGVCQRSGYSIGGRKPLMEAEVERKSAAIQRLWKERDSLREQNAALMEALKSTGLFLHHCWCDVQMNDYSFEKLNQQMVVVDTAIAKAEGEKE